MPTDLLTQVGAHRCSGHQWTQCFLQLGSECPQCFIYMISFIKPASISVRLSCHYTDEDTEARRHKVTALGQSKDTDSNPGICSKATHHLSGLCNERAAALTHREGPGNTVTPATQSQETETAANATLPRNTNIERHTRSEATRLPPMAPPPQHS